MVQMSLGLRLQEFPFRALSIKSKTQICCFLPGKLVGFSAQINNQTSYLKKVASTQFRMMGSNGDSSPAGDSHPIADVDSQGSVLSSNLFLDGVGEVVVTFDSDGLSWGSPESMSNEEDSSLCLGLKLFRRCETGVKFCDVYAVEYNGWGVVHKSSLQNAARLFSGHSFEMYRFAVHYAQKSRNCNSVLAMSRYNFGHKDLLTCRVWVNRIRSSLGLQGGRPKSLLVFVNPRSGKRNGSRTWEAVAPIFSQAEVKTKVTVTERAGQAFDVMASISNKELNSYDGVVAVGGDGFFNEILNGLLLSRHKAPYPPHPAESIQPVNDGCNVTVHDADGNAAEPSDNNNNEDRSPLLPHSELDGRQGATCKGDGDSFLFPNEHFRFGIIPAGSTDAIVICTTGARDHITSALQIVLGKSVCLDIARVIRWKISSTSKDDEPSVRYAASFAGYGFYGDVITESEKYRWMGPTRYDFAGTKVFLRHSSYEAEVTYLEAADSKKGEEGGVAGSNRTKAAHARKKQERNVCRVNCTVCNSKASDTSAGREERPDEESYSSRRWLKSKGRFLSIGCAIISCRNEKAPDGLVADAHLSDGFLHLILIRDCPHASYLWHLMQLAKKGGNPLDFQFVEHCKTTVFTFTSFGKESVWNIDGEPFRAHQLSAQVFRGLITMFATGPEV